jgi:hypothetical protein
MFWFLEKHICIKNEKNIIIENLNFLVWDNFQNCKYLETWIEMLCSFCNKNFVMDKNHVEKNCSKKSWNEWVMNGQSWPSKRSLEKNIDFHLKRLFRKMLKWISNGWSKLAIQKKSKKNILIFIIKVCAKKAKMMNNWIMDGQN